MNVDIKKEHNYDHNYDHDHDHDHDHILIKKGVPIIIVMTGIAVVLFIMSFYNKMIINITESEQKVIQKIDIQKDLTLSLNYPEKTENNINTDLHIILLKNKIKNLKNNETVIYDINTIEKSKDKNIWNCKGISIKNNIETPIILKIAIIENTISEIKN